MAESDAHSKKVVSLLVVDDDEDIRSLMADYLRQHGYDLDSEVNKYVTGLDIDGIVADHDFEGRYDAPDGKLMFSSGRQYAVSSKTYFTYTLKSGSRFDITGGTGGSEKRFLDAFYYPLEFTKQ